MEFVASRLWMSIRRFLFLQISRDTIVRICQVTWIPKNLMSDNLITVFRYTCLTLIGKSHLLIRMVWSMNEDRIGGDLGVWNMEDANTTVTQSLDFDAENNRVTYVQARGVWKLFIQKIQMIRLNHRVRWINFEKCEKKPFIHCENGSSIIIFCINFLNDFLFFFFLQTLVSLLWIISFIVLSLRIFSFIYGISIVLFKQISRGITSLSSDILRVII